MVVPRFLKVVCALLLLPVLVLTAPGSAFAVHNAHRAAMKPASSAAHKLKPGTATHAVGDHHSHGIRISAAYSEAGAGREFPLNVEAGGAAVNHADIALLHVLSVASQAPGELGSDCCDTNSCHAPLLAILSAEVAQFCAGASPLGLGAGVWAGQGTARLERPPRNMATS